MIARHPDAIGAALITLIAIATVAGGLTTPDPGFGVVSPAVFPVVLGVLMLVSGVWLGIDLVRLGRVPELEPFARGPFAATAVAAGLFLAAFVPVGFVISGTAFLVAQSRILGSRALLRDGVVSLAFVLAIYWLFVGFLTIRLPNGPLPF